MQILLTLFWCFQSQICGSFEALDSSPGDCYELWLDGTLIAVRQEPSMFALRGLTAGDHQIEVTVLSECQGINVIGRNSSVLHVDASRAAKFGKYSFAWLSRENDDGADVAGGGDDNQVDVNVFLSNLGVLSLEYRLKSTREFDPNVLAEIRMDGKRIGEMQGNAGWYRLGPAEEFNKGIHQVSVTIDQYSSGKTVFNLTDDVANKKEAPLHFAWKFDCLTCGPRAEWGLYEIMLSAGTDKASVHRYDYPYEWMLGHLRHRPIKILEIGLARGNSLQAWLEYFPKAMVVVCGDKAEEPERIKEIVAKHSDRAIVELRHCANPHDLEQLTSMYGNFDVIIDDASHDPKQQIASIQGLLDHVTEGGWYIIEDIGHGYTYKYRELHHTIPANHPSLTDALQRLVDYLQDPFISSETSPAAKGISEFAGLERLIGSMHVFQNVVMFHITTPNVRWSTTKRQWITQIFPPDPFKEQQ